MSTPATENTKTSWPTPSGGAWAPATRTPDTILDVSLEDVMSEQLATHLQSEEHTGWLSDFLGGSPGAVAAADALKDTLQLGHVQTLDDLGTENDELLARMLQAEFDKEAAAVDNGSSSEKADDEHGEKRSDEADSDSDYDDDDDDAECAVDCFEENDMSREGFTMGRQGFVNKRGKVVTKHDSELCGRRNACRVMTFASDMETGDGGGFDMQLSNHVYNALKVHAMASNKRMARLNEKKKKSTAESVMDETSKLMIFKLINRGVLDEVNGAVNTGKEANVYHGIGGNPEMQVPVGEVAIKVYKTTLNEFKNRDPYIKNDFRFRQRFSKQNPRKIIHLWAEKEMHNLYRIRRAGIPCPEVLMQRLRAEVTIGCSRL